MTILARIFLALLSLALIALAGGLIALAWNDGQMLDIHIENFRAQAWIDGDTAEKVVFTVGTGVAVLIGLVGLMLAFVRRNPARSGMLRLKQAEGGVVEVPASAMEALVVHALGELEMIHDAEAAVAVRGGDVHTELDLTIGPGASISEVTTGASQCLTDVYRDMIGVTNVKRPLVRIIIDDTLPRNPMDTAVPAADELPPAPESPAEEPAAEDENDGRD